MTKKKNALMSLSSWRPIALASELLSSGASKHKKADDIAKDIASWRPIALAGYTIIGLTFGVAGVWASVAELDKAVIAPGYVSTETNHKTVEHFEGGIVRRILVKEGEHVTEGQVLFRLQKVQAEATSEMIQNQLDSALALEARLIAERDHAAQITWPQQLIDRERDPTVAGVIIDQAKQFTERQASLNDQIKVLEARGEELGKEIDGIKIQKDSTEKQVVYINQELVGLRDLGAKKLVPLTRVYAMERERTRLEGVIGQSEAEIAKAQSSIGETKLQIEQLRQKFQEDVNASLLDVRQKIADFNNRSAVAKDVLNRNDIRAPRTGTVQNLKVSTIGQVIRPGEALLDIVPDGEPLVVEAQFSTTDVDNVHAGMRAEIRFPAFHSRTIPVMFGVLESVSHDRLLDELTHQYYFRGIISLSRADIPEEYRSRVRSGMPAEVIVSAGSRTVMNYLISPLTSSLRKSFREPND
jgi:HlyD family secretion protein